MDGTVPDAGITTDLLTFGCSVPSGYRYPIFVIGVLLFLDGVAACQFLSLFWLTVNATHSKSKYLRNHHGSQFPAIQWGWEDANSILLSLSTGAHHTLITLGHHMSSLSTQKGCVAPHRETRAGMHLPLEYYSSPPSPFLCYAQE